MAKDAKNKGQGWHEEPGRHAKAAKGEKTPGSGWHGDPKGHAKAAKGESPKSSDDEGFFDKFKK
jgi:hypothetical protein